MCMCLYVCKCISVCMYIYVCMYVYICVCVYVYVCIYMYIYLYIYCMYVCVCGYICVYVDIYVCMCMYLCVCVYIWKYPIKENLKFQRVLDFSALLPVTSILTSLPQYTGSNTLKLHKITDLYVNFKGKCKIMKWKYICLI